MVNDRDEETLSVEGIYFYEFSEAVQKEYVSDGNANVKFLYKRALHLKDHEILKHESQNFLEILADLAYQKARASAEHLSEPVPKLDEMKDFVDGFRKGDISATKAAAIHFFLLITPEYSGHGKAANKRICGSESTADLVRGGKDNNAKPCQDDDVISNTLTTKLVWELEEPIQAVEPISDFNILSLTIQDQGNEIHHSADLYPSLAISHIDDVQIPKIFGFTKAFITLKLKPGTRNANLKANDYYAKPVECDDIHVTRRESAGRQVWEVTCDTSPIRGVYKFDQPFASLKPKYPPCHFSFKLSVSKAIADIETVEREQLDRENKLMLVEMLLSMFASQNRVENGQFILFEGDYALDIAEEES